MQPTNITTGSQNPNSQPASAPATQGPSQPNFLERLLPTAGGILGGIIGIPGDIFGGAGSIAGAAGGDALGKALENDLTHQSITSGLGGAALSGGVGQGVGGIAGGLLGKVGTGLADAGTNMAANTATDAASQAESDAVKAEAQRVSDTFGGVKSGQGNVGQAVSKAQELGFTNPTPQDLTNIGNTYTGSNPETGTGVLNFIKQNAIEQGGGKVGTNGLIQNLDDTLAAPENGILGGQEPITTSRGLPKPPSNTATQISSQFKKMIPGTGMGDITPQEGVSLLKQVGKQVSATGKVTDGMGAVIPEKQAENNVWKSVYSNVKDAVYNRPEVNAVVQNTTVTPELEATIDDAIKTNGITDPEQAEKIKADLTNTINNSQTAPDLMAAEAPMVNVSKVGESATNDINSDVTSARAVRRATKGITPDSTGTSLDTQPGSTTSGTAGALDVLGGAGLASGHPAGILANVVARAHKAGLTPTIAKTLGSVLTKIAPFAAGTGVVASNAGELGAAPQSNVSSTTGAPTMQPNNTNQIQQLFNTLLAQEQASPANFAGSLGPILSSLAPTLQKQGLATDVASNLTPSFENAGGAQGTGGGLLSQISALIPGTAANSYQRQQQATASTLAQLLGISPQAALQLTPQLTQSPNAAGITGGNLSGILGNISASPTQ